MNRGSQYEPIAARLAAAPIGGYAAAGPPATEPTALASIALLAANETDAALKAGRWLVGLQAHRGSLGIMPDQGEPSWPTAWAVIAWHWLRLKLESVEFDRPISAAVTWLVGERGTTQPRHPTIGHDTTLSGWPWVHSTHSWLEPTALSVLALKHLGHWDDDRVREGVQLILDRQLPEGGCNYGNTVTLGQATLPHAQPTALALLALHGEPSDPRRQQSLNFLHREWPRVRGLASRCFSILALAAHGIAEPDVSERLDQELSVAEPDLGAYRAALVVLASMASEAPILQPRTRTAANVSPYAGMPSPVVPDQARRYP